MLNKVAEKVTEGFIACCSCSLMCQGLEFVSNLFHNSPSPLTIRVHMLVRRYGKHPLSTDGGTWYQYACKSAKIKHHLHSFHDRSIIERTVQYFKDRTECFDDHFPCTKQNCNRQHVGTG
jgi:hypothetical protein